MMAAIGVREEGVGRNRGGLWGRENIKVCTKRYVRLQIRVCGGGEVYVCARDGMHVWYVSTI